MLTGPGILFLNNFTEKNEPNHQSFGRRIGSRESIRSSLVVRFVLLKFLAHAHEERPPRKNGRKGQERSTYPLVSENEMNMKLALMIVKNDRPLNFGESKEFRDLAKSQNPNWKVPSARKVTRLLSRLSRSLESEMQQKESCVMVTTDEASVMPRITRNSELRELL
jgi:hypothetical protein